MSALTLCITGFSLPAFGGGGEIKPAAARRGAAARQTAARGQASRATASSSLVRQVQQQLKDEGLYQTGQVDGIMGPKTQAALRSFQSDYDLPATGRLDRTTAETLGVVAIRR